MSKSLNQIQTIARWEARDDELSLTSESGLALANMIYRRQVGLIAWPEFSRDDSSITIVADQEAYTWPSIKYMDVLSVEVQDPNDDNLYKRVVPARTEQEWSLVRNKKSSFPTVYRRFHDGSNHKIQFGPKPKLSGATVRITGIEEPTEFSDGGDSTGFLLSSADDALALLIAADVAFKRSFMDRGQTLIEKASQILSSLAGKEITPQEIKEKVISG